MPAIYFQSAEYVKTTLVCQSTCRYSMLWGAKPGMNGFKPIFRHVEIECEPGGVMENLSGSEESDHIQRVAF
jgi:hypothetical protein